jgi:hypothetical protein
MTLEELAHESAMLAPRSMSSLSSAVGLWEGLKPAVDVGAFRDESASVSGFGYVVRFLLGTTRIPPQKERGSSARYACVMFDVSQLGTTQWAGVAPKLHIVDAEDFGEATVVDLRGVVSLIRANSAVVQSYAPGFVWETGVMPRLALEPVVYQLVEGRDAFDGLYEESDSFANLVPGWNGFESDPPNSVAIANARLVLDAAKEQGLVPDRLVAGAESVFVYFSNARLYASIECENDGTMSAVVSDRTGNPSVWMVDPNGLTQDLAKIRAYLV